MTTKFSSPPKIRRFILCPYDWSSTKTKPINSSCPNYKSKRFKFLCKQSNTIYIKLYHPSNLNMKELRSLNFSYWYAPPEFMQRLVIWKSLAHTYWGFSLEHNVRKIHIAISSIYFSLLQSVWLCNTLYLILNSSSPLSLSLMQIGVSLKENKFIVLLHIYFP